MVERVRRPTCRLALVIIRDDKADSMDVCRDFPVCRLLSGIMR